MCLTPAGKRAPQYWAPEMSSYSRLGLAGSSCRQSLPLLTSMQCVSSTQSSPTRGTEASIRAVLCLLRSHQSGKILRSLAQCVHACVHMGVHLCVFLFINTGSLGMLHEQSHATWRKHKICGEVFPAKK